MEQQSQPLLLWVFFYFLLYYYVDLGAEKINVCCVDEGQIIPNTSFTKYFGGTDLDHALLRMLN